jgi:hypothetical protein
VPAPLSPLEDRLVQSESGACKRTNYLYAPLSLHDDGKGFSATLERRSSEDDHSAPLLEASDNLPGLAPSKPSQLPKPILHFSVALALLSCESHYTIKVPSLPLL